MQKIFIVAEKYFKSKTPKTIYAETRIKI